jgi:hypothetical protein
MASTVRWVVTDPQDIAAARPIIDGRLAEIRTLLDQRAIRLMRFLGEKQVKSAKKDKEISLLKADIHELKLLGEQYMQVKHMLDLPPALVTEIFRTAEPALAISVESVEAHRRGGESCRERDGDHLDVPGDNDNGDGDGGDLEVKVPVDLTVQSLDHMETETPPTPPSLPSPSAVAAAMMTGAGAGELSPPSLPLIPSQQQSMDVDLAVTQEPHTLLE